MTELVVILFLSLAGTGAAGYLLRWLLGMPVGDREMNRLANLVRETAETFTRRQSSTIAALGALFGGALFLGYGLRTSQSDPVPGLELGIWFVVSFALGLGVTLITGQISTFLMTRGAIRTASGARKSIDVTLQVALRTGTTVALFSGSLSTLTVACLCLAVLAHHGFFGAQPGEALYVVPLMPTLLLGFALGSIFVALLSQLSGGIFSKAADIGADLGAREVGLDDDDVENPAAIANLAGDCAGKGASGAMLGVAVASVEDFGAMLAMAIVYRADTSLRNPFALVLLPLMSRGFSLLASAFGAFVVRTDDREEPSNSLFRGLSVATLLHAVGLFGTIEWLVPGRRSALGGGVAIGLVAALALLGWTHHATMTRFRPVREVADASRGGPTLALLAGVVRGLTSAFWPFLALLVSMYGAFRWALASESPESGLLGLVGFSLGMSGASAFLKALDFTGVAVDAASGIIGMTIGGERRDVRGRLGLLDASGTSNHAASSALMGVAALPSSALFVAAIVNEWTRRSGGSAQSLDAKDAAVMGLACAFGLLLVVFGVSQTVQAVVRSARRVLDEVRRQLRDRDLSDARAGQPVDYHPCSDMAGRFALRQMVMTGLSSVGLVILLIVVLRVIESKDREVVPGGSVSTLIIVATVAAILGSLFASGAGGAWGNAKNYIVTGAHGGRLLVDETGGRAENPTFVSSVIGDTVGDPIKDVAIPFTLALVKLVPVFVLVLLPLLL